MSVGSLLCERGTLQKSFERVARFFLVQFTKTGKHITNYHKINKRPKNYQMAVKYSNGHKIYQHIKYTKI
jgi:hypothetical protein